MPSLLHALLLPVLAAGSGASDDAGPAIQAMLDGPSGHAHIPAGVHRLASSLRLGDGDRISGPGILHVVLEGGVPGSTDGSDRDNVALLLEGSSITVEGITIRKEFVDGSYGVGILATSGSSDIKIRDVDISGYSARYGIHLIEVDGFEIRGCHIHDFMMNTTADMIADSPAGIRVTRSRRGVVADNRVVRIENGPVGVASISPLRPNYGPQTYQSDNMTIMQSEDVAITGNFMETSGEGIDVLLSNRVTISGNVIADIWNEGVKMLGVSDSTVSGNMIRDCTVAIGLSGHSGFDAPCENNAITGNVFLMREKPIGLQFVGRTLRSPEHFMGIRIEGSEKAPSGHHTITGNVFADMLEPPVWKGAIMHGEGERTSVIANNVYRNVSPGN